jgi:hypothetical protein
VIFRYLVCCLKITPITNYDRTTSVREFVD